MSRFYFREFSIRNEDAAMKVGTDAVLLGALATIPEGCRRVLDVGTGTGAIALLCAQRLSGKEDFRVIGIDIDQESALEASGNFADSPWAASMEAHNVPLQLFDGGVFDLIVSNPPYFDNSLVNPEERETRARHTQTLSFRDICAYAREHLSPEKGALSLVLPAEVEKDLVRTAASFSLKLSRIVRIRTTERKPVKRIIAEFIRTERMMDALQETLTIHSADGGYTPAYSQRVLVFLPQKDQ